MPPVVHLSHKFSMEDLDDAINGSGKEAPRFIHIAHDPEWPEGTNLIAMARKLPSAKERLVEFTKRGYYVYVAKEGATRLVRSDYVRSLWIKVREGEFQMNDDDLVYKFTPPPTGIKPKRLLVVLSSIFQNVNSPSLLRYFMENFPTVQKYLPHDTAVLRIGDIGGVMGSFYLNTSHRPNNVASIQRLIETIRTETGLDNDAVVLYGVSKGATAALYHGLLGGYRFVAVDPIVSDEHYEQRMNDAHFTLGGIFPESKQSVFERLVREVKASTSQQKIACRSALICSDRSPQFPYIEKMFIRNFSNEISFFNSQNPAILDHPDVGPKTVNTATMLMNMQLYGLSLTPGVRTID
jgi:hypothetical protein